MACLGPEQLRIMIEFIRKLLMAASNVVVPGTQSHTTAGTYTFTVPAFNTLTVDLWGAGGAGGAAQSGAVNGTGGGATTITELGMTANGGGFGTSLDADAFYRVASAAGAGGTASGGNTLNTSGAAGVGGTTTNNGGAAANGGAGGAGAWYASNSGVTQGSAGGSPGGGGGGGHYDLGGNWLFPGGGGGGANCRSVFDPSTLAPGTVLTIQVGAGGLGPAGNLTGDGADGGATITWS